MIPVSRVDLDATREANAAVPDDPSRETLSVAGGAAAPPPEPSIDEPEEEAPPAPKSTTVHSATWCGYCKQLKASLTARKIPATIIEVDKLPRDQQGAAEAVMRRETGRVAYPTVIIGGEAIAGFSKS